MAKVHHPKKNKKSLIYYTMGDFFPIFGPKKKKPEFLATKTTVNPHQLVFFFLLARFR